MVNSAQSHQASVGLFWFLSISFVAMSLSELLGTWVLAAYFDFAASFVTSFYFKNVVA